MTTLREAAQATADIVPCVCHATKNPPCHACRLQTALSLPDPGGWAAGAEAMREAAILRAEAEEELDGEIPENVRNATYRDPAGALRGAVRATKRGIVAGLRALPVPPATTAPEAGTYEWQDSTGKRTTIRASESRPVAVTLAAPEAKPAESEAVREIVTYAREQYRVRSEINAGAEGHTYENGWCDALAAILTLAGAPVEPEETQR